MYKTYGPNTTDQPQTNTRETSTATAAQVLSNKYSRMICHYCQTKGHIRSQCYALKRAEARTKATDASVVQHVVFKTQKLDNTKQLDTDAVKVNPLFNTNWCTAILTSSNQTQRSLTVLRDSGSLQSLRSRDKICCHDYADTGESRLIKGVTGDVVRVLLVEVCLPSKYGTCRSCRSFT